MHGKVKLGAFLAGIAGRSRLLQRKPVGGSSVSRLTRKRWLFQATLSSGMISVALNLTPNPEGTEEVKWEVQQLPFPARPVDLGHGTSAGVASVDDLREAVVLACQASYVPRMLRGRGGVFKERSLGLSATVAEATLSRRGGSHL